MNRFAWCNWEVADTVFVWVNPGFRDSDDGIRLEVIITVAALKTLPDFDDEG